MDALKLADLFEGLDRISSDQDFSKMHRDFCQWFVKTIRLAKTEEPSLYGHAAKVLDLALKVYVYYCNMPSPAKAESLMARLNGAIDTPILRYLFEKLEDIYGRSCSPRYLWTIKMIDGEKNALGKSASKGIWCPVWCPPPRTVMPSAVSA